MICARFKKTLLKKLETKKAFRGSRLIPGDKNNPDSFKVRRAKVGGYRDYFDDRQIAIGYERQPVGRRDWLAGRGMYCPGINVSFAYSIGKTQSF